MPSSDEPLVSVVFPMFNSEATVANSLGAIEDQTYQNIEILCVDDGCTDRTVELVKEFVDPRIRIISQENRGLGGARNAGIREARGEWITFVDSDDMVLPQMIAAMVEKVRLSPTIDIVDCLHALVSVDGVTLHQRDLPAPGILFDHIFSSRYTPMACSRLFRRRLFDNPDHLFPEHTIFEDTFTVYKLFYAARSVATVPQVLYVWNERPGSLSRGMSRKHVDDTMRALSTGYAFLDQHGIVQSHIGAFYERCAAYTCNLLDKIDRYAGEEAGDLRQYLVDQVNISPFFSTKMRAALNARVRERLKQLQAAGVAWAPIEEASVMLTPAPPVPLKPSAPRRKRRLRRMPPRYQVTFAGLLLMVYDRIKRTFRRQRAE